MQRSPFTIRSTIFRYENKIARNHKNIIRISINSRCAKSIRITGFSYDLASEEWRTVNLNAIKKSVIRFALCTDITNFNYHKWLKFACCRNRSRRLNHRQQSVFSFELHLSACATLPISRLCCCSAVIIFFSGTDHQRKKKYAPFYLIWTHYIRFFAINKLKYPFAMCAVQSQRKRNTLEFCDSCGAWSLPYSRIHQRG